MKDLYTRELKRLLADIDYIFAAIRCDTETPQKGRTDLAIAMVKTKDHVEEALSIVMNLDAYETRD
jgi:hypothetical protein